MKVALLHPPFYLTNYALYHELGKLVELSCYVFGQAPAEHPAWRMQQHYRLEQHSFGLRLLGRGSYPRWQIYSGRFLAQLQQEHFDAVITLAFAPYGFYAALAKRRLGYRMYLMTDANQVSDGQLSPLRRYSRKRLLGLCDKAISAAPATSDYLHSLVPKLPVELAMHTVDVVFFQRRAAVYWAMPQRELRQLLWQKIAQGMSGAGGAPPAPPAHWLEAPLLLGVGRFVRSKNWEQGLALLRQLPQLHYLLVGTGPQDYRRLAEQLGVSGRFYQLPFATAEELVLYYCASDLLYFPSQSETFGFVIAEALSCGLPVLCRSEAGGSALVEPGRSGWLLPASTELDGALLRQYCQLARQPQMRSDCRNFMQERTVAQRAARIAQILAE